VGLKEGDSYVDAFGIMGFVFGIIALVAANSAKTQIAALKKEVETLKAVQQNRGE
jgi:hypothetical protein